MHYIPLIAMLISAFAIMENCNEPHSSAPPDVLYEHWTHSHEDDGEDYKIFRPSAYDFPPSRGREGFEAREDGTFIWHRIAPADGTEKVEGNWTWDGKDTTLTAKFPEGAPREVMKLKILDVYEERLKVRK